MSCGTAPFSYFFTMNTVDSMTTLRHQRPSRLTTRPGNTLSINTLCANILETPVVPLINEQDEKEKGRDEWHFSWCSSLGGFGWRGTERRRAKRAAAQASGSQSGRRLSAGLGS